MKAYVQTTFNNEAYNFSFDVKGFVERQRPISEGFTKDVMLFGIDKEDFFSLSLYAPYEFKNCFCVEEYENSFDLTIDEGIFYDNDDETSKFTYAFVSVDERELLRWNRKD